MLDSRTTTCFFFVIVSYLYDLKSPAGRMLLNHEMYVKIKLTGNVALTVIAIAPSPPLMWRLKILVQPASPNG